MPFEAHTFDVVMVESVTNFADAQKAVSEYYRVLKSEGKLYDREVIKVKEMTSGIHRALCSFYGVSKIYKLEEWRELLESNKFSAVTSQACIPSLSRCSKIKCSTQILFIYLTDNRSWIRGYGKLRLDMMSL